MAFSHRCCASDRRVLCLFYRQAAAYDSAMTCELSEEAICLQPGQSLRIAVDAGCSLWVAEGSVRIVAPPSWFGETMFSATAMLQEGEVYRAERGGWIEVAALRPARLQGAPRAAPSVRAASSRVARLVQLLAG